jgi:hypothetical protein
MISLQEDCIRCFQPNIYKMQCKCTHVTDHVMRVGAISYGLIEQQHVELATLTRIQLQVYVVAHRSYMLTQSGSVNNTP